MILASAQGIGLLRICQSCSSWQRFFNSKQSDLKRSKKNTHYYGLQFVVQNHYQTRGGGNGGQNPGWTLILWDKNSLFFWTLNHSTYSAGTQNCGVGFQRECITKKFLWLYFYFISFVLFLFLWLKLSKSNCEEICIQKANDVKSQRDKYLREIKWQLDDNLFGRDPNNVCQVPKRECKRESERNRSNSVQKCN